MTLMKTTVSKTSLTQSLATVTGVLASTVVSSHAAATINQITLSSNLLSTSLNGLNADLTGDGTNDITLGAGSGNNGAAYVLINGNSVGALRYTIIDSSSNPRMNFIVDAIFANGGVGVGYQASLSLQNIKYLNPISFTDARINGGATTQGYLEVNAFNASPLSHTVALTRLVFDPNSTTMTTAGLSTGTTYTEWVAPAIPEPSSLGLLALGAGGLLARRRRQAA